MYEINSLPFYIWLATSSVAISIQMHRFKGFFKDFDNRKANYGGPWFMASVFTGMVWPITLIYCLIGKFYQKRIRCTNEKCGKIFPNHTKHCPRCGAAVAD